MSFSVQSIIERWTQQEGSAPSTVDGLIAGHPDMSITGVAVAFMATHHVLEQAVAQGLNMIITHEGLYYSHHHPNPWLDENDPIAVEKQRFIEQHQLSIYRYHDHCHQVEPDLITEGLVRSLGWEQQVQHIFKEATTVELPGDRSVADIATHIKQRLGLPYVRVAGDARLNCRRIGLTVGYRGGGLNGVTLLQQHGVDLIIAGEGPEWETPEYVRDAVSQGSRKALIMIGHAPSEEPGMRLFAERLQQQLPELPVRFLATEPLYHIV